MTQIAVSKLPIDPGPAGWEAILPPAPPARILQEDISADWLIIGASFAGLSAARRLSQLRPEDRIAVVDAKRVAEGPGGRNSGFMIDLPHDLASDSYSGEAAQDRHLIADNRHAIRFAAQMAEEFGLGADVFAPCGKVNAAATPKGHTHNLGYARHLAELGEPSELLDAAQMQALTGTEYYQSGLFTAGSVVLQPAAYLRGVAAGIRSNRVEIFERSPVTALDAGRDWVATTPSGRIHAPKVILAVNGHLNSFGYLENRLMHVFTYASMTRALSEGEAASLGGAKVWGVTSADPMGSTLRRINTEAGARLVIRNRFTYDPSMEVDDARISRVARDHDRALLARFPQLGGVEMEHRWGGRLCLSRNNVSVVEELSPGLFAACCQNGLGTVRGTLSGLLAAELATGTTSDRLDRMLASDPPVSLPMPVLMKPGAAAYLRWQERKAGREM